MTRAWVKKNLKGPTLVLRSSLTGIGMVTPDTRSNDDNMEADVCFAEGLCAFVDASPTPYHCVETVSGRSSNGFTELVKLMNGRL